MTPKEPRNIASVVDAGYCIGCGVCVVASRGAITINRSALGMYEACVHSDIECAKNLVKLCPFSEEARTEDEIAEPLFGMNPFDGRIGYYRDLYIGHVSESDYRERGTSGGIITWLGVKLLSHHHVDGVIHVTATSNANRFPMFNYSISRSHEEVKVGAKSRYYPVQLADVLEYVRRNPGRYAIVGLPCFLKAVRNLCELDTTFKERILVYVGLVCGHLKSAAFADCLGWQLGISPADLKYIDFRVKLKGQSARAYGVRAEGAGKSITAPISSLIGRNWGHDLFRYPACDYCDDVFAEVADVTIGDAWLPGYDADPRGNSVLVVRSALIADLVRRGIAESKLSLQRSSTDNIAASQLGGLRDRREGLAYRLASRMKEGHWVPRRRVKPDLSAIPAKRCRIYLRRLECREASHRLWQESLDSGDLGQFFRRIRKYTTRVDREYVPFYSRALGRMRRLFARVLAWG